MAPKSTKTTKTSSVPLPFFLRALSVLRGSTALGVVALLAAPFASAQRVEISWPTPNSAWERGRSYESWVQPTVSGEARSGLWGSVRSSGTQFHEGLDIKPVDRDSRGEAVDLVTAAMDGVGSCAT
jgi:peptidoglycan LD-endopeptidase LytH